MRPLGLCPIGLFLSVFPFPCPLPFTAPLRFDLPTQKIETEESYMAKINLRDYYPFYQYDCDVDVSQEVADALLELDRLESAFQRQLYRHKAYYSLDRGDGIERDILFVSLSPSEIYERKVTYAQLHAAIASLPDTQAKRVYAHFFMEMSNAAIAKAEGVSEAAVRDAIDRGLRNIEKYLKKYC